jgi:UDP-N-acetylmuramate dehydrogenase
MINLREFIGKINTEAGFTGELRWDEPLAAHTSFRVGGPADCWVRPGEEFPRYARMLLAAARREGVPVFVLGGGANLVAGDRGIRGIVLDTGGWKGCFPEGKKGDGPVLVRFRSGSSLDEAAEAAAERGLSGLEFLAGMPGSVGGAVWMNARCYGQEIADVLAETELLGEGPGGGPSGLLEYRRLPRREGDFSYKKSPFQGGFSLILSALFSLCPRPRGEIRREMEEHRRDREAKGHYRYPSAGSAFKNDRSFGAPTGQIIDELGLKGLSVGGAAVAPFHGNIIINTGGARAADIRALLELVRERVRRERSFNLEPELLFVGDP